MISIETFWSIFMRLLLVGMAAFFLYAAVLGYFYGSPTYIFVGITVQPILYRCYRRFREIEKRWVL